MAKKIKSDINFSNFFIIGCNRSGTSLLRTMLNHHPDVAVPLESLFLVDYLKADGKVDINLQKDLLKHEPMLNEWGVKMNKAELDRIKDTTGILKSVHESYAKKQQKRVWGNKTPRMTRYVADIKEYLPDAVFIHMVRDPRAVALSLSNSKIHKSNIYFGAKRWVRYLKSALESEKKYKDYILRVYYEDLVNEPERTLKCVCKLIGIKYTSKMLNYQNTGNKEYRKYHNSAHSNLKKSPQKDRINAWKKELTKREIQIIENVCGEIMEEFGYERVHKDAPLKTKYVYYYRIERLYGFSLQFLRYLLLWPSYLFYSIWRKIRLGTFFEEIRGVNY